MNYPEPFTPPDCELQDFPYMPLDVLRLRDSDLAARTTGEEFRCAVLLWCASWHQVPAASLPDDDVNLAQYAGFGRAVAEWRKVREASLRGWIKCADGRLYHAVVAEKANESWLAKHRRAHEKLGERVRKKNKDLKIPPLETWIEMGRPLERDLFPEEFGSFSGGKPAPVPRKAPEIPPENALKGKGTEQNGEVNPKTPSPTGDSGTPPREDSDVPLAAAAISIALIGWERERNKAARGISASQQQVIDLAEMHVTPDELRKAYDLAVADRLATNDPNAVNAGFVKAKLQTVRNPPKARPPRDNWSASPEGVLRKSREIGFGDGRPGESTEALKNRIFDELARRERNGVPA